MATKVKKVVLLDRLLSEGFFTSKEEAVPYLMGGQVYVGSQQQTSAAAKVDPLLPLTVRGLDMPYISKGGLKLEGAIRDFGIQVQDRVCIDAGACTGGFTDCFIKHGAARVYAVEVGFGQLAGSLRQNPRVVNLEKTNISDEKLLHLDPAPDLASVDLSYLSLRKGIPAFAEVMHHQGELLCLVKPLFETEDMEARRTGVLPPEKYLPTLLELVRDVNALPETQAKQVTYSPVTGNNGTHEFFLHVVLGSSTPAPDLTAACERAVANVLALAPYHKK